MHLLGHAQNIFTLLALMGLNDYDSQPTCQLYGNSAEWWGMKKGQSLTTNPLITRMPAVVQQGGLFAASRVIYEVLDISGVPFLWLNVSSSVNDFEFSSNGPKKFNWEVSSSTDNCTTFSKPIKLLSDGHGEFWDQGTMFTQEYRFGYLALEWIVFSVYRRNMMVNIFGEGRPHKIVRLKKKPSSLIVSKMERRVYGFNPKTDDVEYKWVDSSEESWIKLQNITAEFPCQVIEPCGSNDFLVAQKTDNVKFKVKVKDDNKLHKRGFIKVYNPCDPNGDWINSKTWDTINLPDLGSWSSIDVESSERSLKVSIIGQVLLDKTWKLSKHSKDNDCDPNVNYMAFENVEIAMNCNP